LIVVADRATSQLADREPQTERSVEREHAEESALHMYAREIVIPAPDIHRPFDATQQFALGLFDDLKDAREVQTPGGICVSPTQTAVEFYESSHVFGFFVGEEACRLAQEKFPLVVIAFVERVKESLIGPRLSLKTLDVRPVT
jgi:hypothetical protein